MKPAALGVLYNNARTKVLLIKRRDVPVWVLPGGGIEEGEQPEAAAGRELWEETGLRVKVVRLIAEYTPVNHLSRQTFIYECQKQDGALRKGCETSAVDFFPLDELPNNLFIVHRDWLEDAFQNSPEVIRKPIWRVTYWEFFKYFCCHPLQVIRFLLNK